MWTDFYFLFGVADAGRNFQCKSIIVICELQCGLVLVNDGHRQQSLRQKQCCLHVDSPVTQCLHLQLQRRDHFNQVLTK